MEIATGHPLEMKFMPWKVSGDPSMKEVNVEAFRVWYNQMVDVGMSQQRIPRSLLDGYSAHIWFGVTHKQNFIRPMCVP